MEDPAKNVLKGLSESLEVKNNEIVKLKDFCEILLNKIYDMEAYGDNTNNDEHELYGKASKELGIKSSYNM